MRKFNFEWMGTFNPLFIGQDYVTFLSILIAIFLAVLILRIVKTKPRWPWFELMAFALFAAIGVSAARFVSTWSYAMIALGCYLASQIKLIKDFWQKVFRTACVCLTVLFLTLGFKNIFYGYSIVEMHRQTGLGLDPHLAPEKAADYVDSLNLKGNIFNTQVLGGFLVWKWNEKRPIFYDGFVIDAKFFYTAYSDFARPNRFDEAVRKYNIEAFIFDRFKGIEPFLEVLVKHPEWQLSYQDEYSLVFTRK